MDEEYRFSGLNLSADYTWKRQRQVSDSRGFTTGILLAKELELDAWCPVNETILEFGESNCLPIVVDTATSHLLLDRTSLGR